MNLFSEFEGLDIDAPEQLSNAAAKLMSLAETGVHDPVDFIRSPDELRAAKALAKANGKLAKGFGDASRKACSKHICGLEDGIDDPQLLFDARNLELCSEFYQEEADLLSDKIDEYKSYLRSGHYLDAYLFFRYRPEEDLFDHRTQNREA